MLAKWWSDGLVINVRIRPAGFALALAYALSYCVAREVSFDQFYLPAGVRVMALLLCPPRLWSYLLVGEYCSFAWLRYPLVEQYGVPWAVLGSAFLMPAVMLIVHLHRKVINTKTEIWLICVAASSAAATTALNVGFSYLLWSDPPIHGYGTNVVRFLVGDVVGILTLAPIALLWSKRREEQGIKVSSLMPTLVCLSLMLLIGGVTLWGPLETVAARTNLLLLMALPAVALTCLHGWRGAAVSVPLWSLITRLTMPATGMATSFDPAAFSVQQGIAIVGISLLGVGSCFSYYFQQYQANAHTGRYEQALTRSSQVAGEMDLRQRALDIRKLGDVLDTSLSELADWLRQKGHQDLADSLLNVTVVHSRKFREQITMVFPTSLEHVGLYLALQIGGINEVWKLTNRLTLHRLAGDPCQLSLGLQLAAYRLLTEAVSLLLENESGQIRVMARCGKLGERQGILLTIALRDSDQMLSGMTTALAVERLTGRTLAYSGIVRCRRNRIRLMLVEPVEPGSARLQ